MDLYRIIEFGKDTKSSNDLNQTMKSTQKISEYETTVTYVNLIWNVVLTIAMFTFLIVIVRIKSKLTKEVNYIKAKICDKISPTSNAKHPGNQRFVYKTFMEG